VLDERPSSQLHRVNGV